MAVAVVLLLAGGAVPPVAATSGVTVSINVPAGVAPASDFTAVINISEVADFDACNYDVTFDTSVLRLDAVTAGLVGSTEIPVDIFNELSPGTYRIIQNVPGLAGVNGVGHLAELHFHVIGSAGESSPVDPSNGVLSNTAAGEIEATWVEGTVTVATEALPATPPPAANSSAEVAATLPSESTGPAPLLPPAAESGGVPVIWLIVCGVILAGIIILLVVARMRAY